jgi:hypothetical protein
MICLNCLIERRPVLDEIHNKMTNPTQMNFDEFKSITSRIQKTDKYLMKTYRALVRVHTRGRTNYVKTEVRAESQQDARWLLWAQYGFHSIYSGPDVVNTRRAA